jgi:hypothetical protein
VFWERSPSVTLTTIAQKFSYVFNSVPDQTGKDVLVDGVGRVPSQTISGGSNPTSINLSDVVIREYVNTTATGLEAVPVSDTAIRVNVPFTGGVLEMSADNDRWGPVDTSTTWFNPTTNTVSSLSAGWVYYFRYRMSDGNYTNVDAEKTLADTTGGTQLLNTSVGGIQTFNNAYGNIATFSIDTTTRFLKLVVNAQFDGYRPTNKLHFQLRNRSNGATIYTTAERVTSSHSRPSIVKCIMQCGSAGTQTGIPHRPWDFS